MYLLLKPVMDSFSPFVVTVDGAMAPEAVLFLRRLAERLLICGVGRGVMARYWVGLRHGFLLL